MYHRQYGLKIFKTQARVRIYSINIAEHLTYLFRPSQDLMERSREGPSPIDKEIPKAFDSDL